MIKTVVAAALFRPDGAVLIQKRSAGKQHAGLWEFPGGKPDPGETPAVALARELQEELGIDVAPEALAPISFSTTPLADGGTLLLLLFGCREWRGEPQPVWADALAWVRAEELVQYAMPPADIPLITPLIARAESKQ